MLVIMSLAVLIFYIASESESNYNQLLTMESNHSDRTTQDVPGIFVAVNPDLPVLMT